MRSTHDWCSSGVADNRPLPLVQCNSHNELRECVQDRFRWCSKVLILGFKAVVTEFCGARRVTATRSH